MGLYRDDGREKMETTITGYVGLSAMMIHS